MAKIALISSQLTPQTLGLAQSLQFHRHEVLIITSFGEPVPDGLNLQVLRYFKSWSAFEAIKFFPHLLGHAPDVWHFVFASQTQHQNLPKTGHWVLAQAAKALPRRVVAVSFYESLFEVAARKVIPMLKVADIVTTATREQLMFIKRRSWLKSYCETEVLPPFVLNSNSPSKEAIDQDLVKLMNSMQPYLVIPSERLPSKLSEDPQFESFLKSKNLIICGSRQTMRFKTLGLKNSPSQVAFVGSNLSDATLHRLLEKSQGLLTAFDHFSAVELLNFHRVCQQTHTPILATARQAEALPGMCVHGKNGFIIDNGLRSLVQLLDNNPQLSTPADQYHSISSDLTDSALNELNRLYSKVQFAKAEKKDQSIDIKTSSLS